MRRRHQTAQTLSEFSAAVFELRARPSVGEPCAGFSIILDP